MTKTSIDVDAVDRLRDLELPPGIKGIPLDADGLTVGQLADSRWHVLGDGLPLPLMVLKESAVAANVQAMAAYCGDHGVSLAPHGKTTMAPQLFRRQIEAGAWALTAATPSHLAVYRSFGVQRVLYANELVEPAAITWVAAELGRDPDFELFCLVDSIAAVERLDRGLATNGTPRRVGVLVEVGYAGQRCGVRDRATAGEVAAAADAAAHLDLVGVECYEGLVGDGHDTGRVDTMLTAMRDVVGDLLRDSSLGERPEIVVSAGGSAYFDRVVATFVDRWEAPTPAHVVLRSGCYITQDGGFYQETSPLAGRGEGPPRLHDAIEMWSVVLSRPEPGRAICGLGRRDAPVDMGLPRVTKRSRDLTDPTAYHGATVEALNDQHAQLTVDPADDLAPGDLVGCSISHPCTAFDKWRVIPLVDDDYRICDTIVTRF